MAYDYYYNNYPTPCNTPTSVSAENQISLCEQTCNAINENLTESFLTESLNLIQQQEIQLELLDFYSSELVNYIGNLPIADSPKLEVDANKQIEESYSLENSSTNEDAPPEVSAQEYTPLQNASSKETSSESVVQASKAATHPEAPKTSKLIPIVVTAPQSPGKDEIIPATTWTISEGKRKSPTGILLKRLTSTTTPLKPPLMQQITTTQGVVEVSSPPTKKIKTEEPDVEMQLIMQAGPPRRAHYARMVNEQRELGLRLAIIIQDGLQLHKYFKPFKYMEFDVQEAETMTNPDEIKLIRDSMILTPGLAPWDSYEKDRRIAYMQKTALKNIKGNVCILVRHLCIAKTLNLKPIGIIVPSSELFYSHRAELSEQQKLIQKLHHIDLKKMREIRTDLTLKVARKIDDTIPIIRELIDEHMDMYQEALLVNRKHRLEYNRLTVASGITAKQHNIK